MTHPNSGFRNTFSVFSAIAIACVLVSNCQQERNTPDQKKQEIASEIDSVLSDQYKLWYPRTVDTLKGGFLSRFTYDWQRVGSQDKMIVTQARHVWTSSKVAYIDSWRKDFLQYAKHGFDFLKNTMWDKEQGGFYTLVSREGEAIPGKGGTIRKTLYVWNAFGRRAPSEKQPCSRR